MTKLQRQARAKRRRYNLSHPWVRFYHNARGRCRNPRHPRFHQYGGKGTKMSLTVRDLERLWWRDNAALMRKPSLDRIKTDGDYTFANCRFIEHKHNVGFTSRTHGGQPWTDGDVARMRSGDEPINE